MKYRIKSYALYLFLLCIGLIFSTASFSQYVACGAHFSLFTCNNGSAKSCGINNYGQLGDGTVTQKNSPVQVSGLSSGIISVSAGRIHSLFLKNDSTVWSVGYNEYGQLGMGDTLERHIPVKVNGLTGITAISARDWFSLTLKSDSTVWGYGRNDLGELGDSTIINRLIPTQTKGLTGIIAIAAGGAHSLFLKGDGTVWSSGDNGSGQLGIGISISNKIFPVQVHGPNNVGYLTGIIGIAASGSLSLFLRNDSTVWACGQNNGTFGDGTFNNSYYPVQSQITGVVAIGAGWTSSYFIKNNGTVWASGANAYGELGNGTTLDTTLPVQVSGLTNVIYATGGQRHSLFVKSDGTVWSCGRNIEGQLGIGNQTEQHIPVQLPSLCSVVGEEEFEVSDLGFEVYPNPSDGNFTVGSWQQAVGKAYKIEIINMLGEKVYSHSFSESVDISNQPDGIYFLQLKTAEGIVSKKIVVQK